MKNSKKYLYIGVIALLLVIGVSLAYFGITIIGNDTAKGNKVVTGNLELTYTDTNEITLDNAFPGDSFTKTISVKNTGTKEVSYNLVWQELNNEITNGELTVEATCKRLNSSGIEEGTCEAILQTPVSNNAIKRNISIESNITHEYIIKVTFIDTGKNQDHNKNKSFTGTLGIEEYMPTQFEKDSWTTIAANVKANNISEYNIGDTKTVDMGDYGTHTIRIANTSTPDECKTEGFSQTACGFVLEFADIIAEHAANDTKTSAGGWPASSMYTFVNTDIYNALPSDLKNIIIDTTVTSGNGLTSEEGDFVSTDKLYLLAPLEIWSNWSTFNKSDTSNNSTRTLDYYKNLGITTYNYREAIKKNGTTGDYWWLRVVFKGSNYGFYIVFPDGSWDYDIADDTESGISPAFRIG